MKNHTVTLLMSETYLKVIENSVGSNLFRNFYAEVDGKREDIVRDGQLSCAFFVSSILLLFKFIKTGHSTVDSTVKDLKESGWTEISEPSIGCVLVWERVDFGDGDFHKHIGFYVAKNEAISNNSKIGHPTKHDWTFNGERKIELMLWNPKAYSGNLS